jgi:hypothetical protein
MHHVQLELKFTMQPNEIFGIATKSQKPAIRVLNPRSPLQAETTSGINPEGHHEFN